MNNQKQWIKDLEEYVKKVVKEHYGKFSLCIMPANDGDPEDTPMYATVYSHKQPTIKAQGKTNMQLLLGPILFTAKGDVEKSKELLDDLKTILELYDVK